MSTLIIPFTVVLFTSAVAACTDLRRFKVYNVLTYPVFLGGIVFWLVMEGQAGLLWSLSGVLFAFCVLLLPYMLGALGAGDVKFVAAIGAWLGAETMLWALAIGGIATGIYSAILVVKHRRYREVWVDLKLIFLRLAAIGRQFGRDDDVESVQALARKDDRRQRLVPFSAMVAIGIVITIAWQFWWT